MKMIALYILKGLINSEQNLISKYIFEVICFHYHFHYLCGSTLLKIVISKLRDQFEFQVCL